MIDFAVISYKGLHYYETIPLYLLFKFLLRLCWYLVNCLVDGPFLFLQSVVLLGQSLFPLCMIACWYLLISFKRWIGYHKNQQFVEFKSYSTALTQTCLRNKRYIDSEFWGKQRYLEVILSSCETHQLKLVLLTQSESISVV